MSVRLALLDPLSGHPLGCWVRHGGMVGTSPSMYWGTVPEGPEPVDLAHFYARLLGWRIIAEAPDRTTLQPPDGGVAYLAFQPSAQYVRPVWPPQPGQQQMMLHLDFEVADLDDAVRHALACGAVLSEHQPQDDVRVLLDPVGHPFCLYLGK